MKRRNLIFSSWQSVYPDSASLGDGQGGGQSQPPVSGRGRSQPQDILDFKQTRPTGQTGTKLQDPEKWQSGVCQPGEGGRGRLQVPGEELVRGGGQ